MTLINDIKQNSLFILSGIVSIYAIYKFSRNTNNINNVNKFKYEEYKSSLLKDNSSSEHKYDSENEDLESNCSLVNDDELKNYFDSNKTNLLCHNFDTSYKIERGFMHKTDLNMNEIGFFNLGYNNNHSFWMKDTLISLDIIFVDKDMNVVGFIEDAEPLSEKSLFINKVSYNVVEANAGFIKFDFLNLKLFKHFKIIIINL